MTRWLPPLALTAVIVAAFLPPELGIGELPGDSSGFGGSLEWLDWVGIGLIGAVAYWCMLQRPIHRALIVVPALATALPALWMAARRYGVAMWDGMDEEGRPVGGTYDIFPGPSIWLVLLAAALLVTHALTLPKRVRPRHG